MFGSKTTSEGKEITEGFASVMAGEKVVGNKFLSFDFAKDRETGEVLTNKAEFKFTQSNGAIFTVSFLDSTESWSYDRTNRQLLHMFTKVVTETEYYDAIGAPKDFVSFIEILKEKLAPKMEGKSFTMKIVLNHSKTTDKWYTGIPKVGRFMELDGTTPSTLSPTNPKYDIYVRPTTSTPEESTTEGSSGDMPF